MRIPQIMQIPDTFDADDRRRRQILSIILSFFIPGGLFSILATFIYGDPFIEVIRDPDGSLILLSSTSVVVVFGLLFALNRYQRAGSLAGWLFVLSGEAPPGTEIEARLARGRLRARVTDRSGG